MNDAFVMRRGESVCDLHRVFDCFALWNRAAFEDCAQAFTLEQFRDEIRRTAARSDVINGKNVGVIQRCDGLRFLLEAPQTLRIFRERLWQNLDRYFAPEPRIAGA